MKNISGESIVDKICSTIPSLFLYDFCYTKLYYNTGWKEENNEDTCSGR